MHLYIPGCKIVLFHNYFLSRGNRCVFFTGSVMCCLTDIDCYKCTECVFNEQGRIQGFTYCSLFSILLPKCPSRSPLIYMYVPFLSFGDPAPFHPGSPPNVYRMCALSSKHETLSQCWVNVGSPTQH